MALNLCRHRCNHHSVRKLLLDASGKVLLPDVKRKKNQKTLRGQRVDEGTKTLEKNPVLASAGGGKELLVLKSSPAAQQMSELSLHRTSISIAFVLSFQGNDVPTGNASPAGTLASPY